MEASNNPNPVDQLPAPEVVRERLSSNLREARLLRSLLRVSERAARDRGRAQCRAEHSRPAGDGKGPADE